MNVTTFGKLSNNLVVVVVIIVLCLKYEALLRVLSLLSLDLLRKSPSFDNRNPNTGFRLSGEKEFCKGLR